MTANQEHNPAELDGPVGAFDIDGADVALLFGVDWSSVVPSEIRLFGQGFTATKKGDFLFDEDAAVAVMDRFRDQGVDRLPFDAAHGMLNPSAPPDSHKALGWFIPVIKDDVEGGGGLALFASEIQWTKAGLEALQAREFRFFSPAITVDPESRRITGLINVALTNIPATKNQRPLVLDASEAEPKTIEETKDMKVLLDTLGASDESGAVAMVGELQSFKADILAALDGVSDKEAAEKIASLSQLAKDAIEAKAQVAALEKEKAEQARVAKLDALCAEGKLPPAQKEFAAKLSDEQLDEFVKTLSSIVGKAVEEPKDHDKVETLSDEEKEAGRLLFGDENALKEGDK